MWLVRSRNIKLLTFNQDLICKKNTWKLACVCLSLCLGFTRFNRGSRLGWQRAGCVRKMGPKNSPSKSLGPSSCTCLDGVFELSEITPPLVYMKINISSTSMVQSHPSFKHNNWLNKKHHRIIHIYIWAHPEKRKNHLNNQAFVKLLTCARVKSRYMGSGQRTFNTRMLSV